MTHTPLIKQYLQIKKQYPDHIVFFQVGDFFEMFMEDAFLVNQLLDLTLTQKNSVPMCGVPIANKDVYINRLVKLNKKVVLCQQTQHTSNNIINRDVTSILTPATALNMDKENFYLLAVTENNNTDQYSINYVDFSTQECFYTHVTPDKLHSKILQISPKEIIIPQNIDFSLFKMYENILSVLPIHENEPINLIKYYTTINKQDFNYDLRIIEEKEHLEICNNTLNNLNLVHKEDSLLAILDFTQTTMGYRYLKSVILHPLIKLQDIKNRQHILQYFLNLYKTQPFLKIKIQDMRKMLTHIKTITDLKNLGINIDKAIELINITGHQFLVRLKQIGEFSVNKIIHDNINDDYQYTCQKIQQLKHEQNQLYLQMNSYSNNKIKRNNLIGFFIELKTHQKPQDEYILKQGMVNCNRYTSPKLLQMESQMITIEQKISEEETNNFNWIKEQCEQSKLAIQSLCDIVAEIDYFYSCAQAAVKYDYQLPNVTNEPHMLHIKNAYHPIIQHKIHFIPNDLQINEKSFMFLITGPNMGGKSTYLKTNALIIIMAQCGMMVPAQATITIVEKIFMRIGASDNLIQGKSTFMLEMLDCANIIKYANHKSLILIDELGRGTSTVDGMSISIAIIEYLHNVTKAISLIATHYNELSSCSNYLSGLHNLKTSIKESTLLYKITSGISDGSFGIFAAKTAGLPSDIIHRANQLESQIKVTIKI